MKAIHLLAGLALLCLGCGGSGGGSGNSLGFTRVAGTWHGDDLQIKVDGLGHVHGEFLSSPFSVFDGQMDRNSDSERILGSIAGIYKFKTLPDAVHFSGNWLFADQGDQKFLNITYSVDGVVMKDATLRPGIE